MKNETYWEAPVTYWILSSAESIHPRTIQGFRAGWVVQKECLDHCSQCYIHSNRSLVQRVLRRLSQLPKVCSWNIFNYFDRIRWSIVDVGSSALLHTASRHGLLYFPLDWKLLLEVRKAELSAAMNVSSVSEHQVVLKLLHICLAEINSF